MIEPKAFINALKNRHYSFFTGVPCSFFQSAINCVIDDPLLNYHIVPNEGSALALAAGSTLSGKPSVVMLQNSGLGNLINPLTSLNMIYDIPVLIFISGRAYGVSDEPQHEVIGKSMGALFDSIGVYHRDVPDRIEKFEMALKEATEWMNNKKQPFVFFVKKGTVGSFKSTRKARSSYALRRSDAIRIISDELNQDDYVVATTGKPSRELFALKDRAQNFYMQGSMGHAPAIGLGIALNQTKKRVIILDGDGALLMHMGILSTIGHYRPKNVVHIVLDNEAYETTGNQDTTSSTTDFAAVAKSCGYSTVTTVVTKEMLKKSLRSCGKGIGPHFIRIKINRIPTEKIPRITTKYTSSQITKNFMVSLLKAPLPESKK